MCHVEYTFTCSFSIVFSPALSDLFRNYFFNGGYLIKNPAKYKVAGTVFTYERTRFGQERIFALGPTTVPVQVEVSEAGTTFVTLMHQWERKTSFRTRACSQALPAKNCIS